MDRKALEETIATWSSVVGTLLGLLGVFQSLTWMAAVGGTLLTISIAMFFYARQQQERLNLAALRIEGRSIDSLNAGNLARKFNSNLVLQEARNVATISGEDLSITWECIGYCRGSRAAEIEFSLDSDNNVPFADLDCRAYDLRYDPDMTHGIRPLLIGSDGISKKIAVPFLSPLSQDQPFHIVLLCELPGCMKSGVEYYTTSISFEQDAVDRYSMRLVFRGVRPDWVRVYDLYGGTAHLTKNLESACNSEDGAEYYDSERDLNAHGARIYLFSREIVYGDQSESSHFKRRTGPGPANCGR